MVDYSEILDKELVVKEGLLLRKASRVKRLVNLLTDYLGFLVFAFTSGLFFYWTGIHQFFMNPAIRYSEAYETFFGLFIIFLYYVLSEYFFWGKTVGKYLTKTKVVNHLGEPPTFIQVLKRTLLRFIPFEGISFLFPQTHGWHDRFSETLVVEEE